MPSLPISLRGTARALLAAMPLMVSLSGCGRWKDDATLLAEARTYQSQGEPRSAIIQLKNVLQHDPANGAARILLGQIYLEVGDAVSAEKELERAVQLKMPPADVLPALGAAMVRQGHYAQALERLPDDPGQARTQAVRGDALLGLQRLDAARTVFEQLLVRQPASPGALVGLARIAQREQHPDAALSLAERAIAAAPNEPAAYRLRGELLQAQGKFDVALASLRQAAKLRPQLVQARADIVALYLRSGQLALARTELASVRKMAPGSPELAYQQALLDFRQRQYASAQEQLQLVLRAAPDHLPSILLMGAVELARGELPQSEQHLRRFLAAYPGQPYATRLLASIAVRNGNADDALRLLTPLLGGQQDGPETLALAGEAYMQLRQYAKASAMFAQASALAPAAAPLHAALGQSRMAMGETEAALAELERAARMDRDNPRPGLLLVLAQLHSGKPELAMRTIAGMEQHQGDNVLIDNLRGGVLLAKKDMTAARASFQHALTHDPHSQAALDNLTQLDLYEHHPEQARQRLESALAGDTRNAGLLTALGRLALVQGQLKVAKGWFERAARASPDAPQPAIVLARFHLQYGDAQQALLIARKLQASFPEQPDVLGLLAEAQGAAGNGEAALDSWSKLDNLRPGNAAVQLRIANTELALKRTAPAMRRLEQAIALQPDYPEAQAMLARLQMRERSYGAALANIRALRQQHPDHALSYQLEGDLLMQQRQAAGALRAYQRGYELQPGGPLVIAIHDAQRMAGHGAAAQAGMARWLGSHPDDQAVRMRYAEGLLADKDYAAALAQFDEAVRQDPGNIIALNDLAWVCQQRHDPRAASFAERAYRLAPHNAAVLDTLGWILNEQGQTARALSLLQQASAAAPASLEVRYHYAVLLANAGRRQDARAQFEQLLANKDFGRREEVQAMLARW